VRAAFRLLAGVALAMPAGLQAQVAAPAAPAFLVLDSVRSVMPARMRELGIPGASVTVIKDGKVVVNSGFGMSDIELRVTAESGTRFRVGSVAKPMTAVALLLLVEEGRVDLDAEVQRYAPGFPRKSWPVTVRQVAGHQAGIRHYKEGEFENQRPYATLTDGLAMFAADSLLFEPGTGYGYSSFGYNLLGAVIEGASGMPYLRFMQERVFAPLGMRSTIADFPDSIIVGRARFYLSSDSGRRVLNAPYVDNSYKWPSGGFLSTTEDLARFGQAMLEGRLLGPAMRDLMWTPMRTRDGTDTGYGVGWSVRPDAAGRRRVYHTGGSMGAVTILAIYPGQRLVIAITDNSDAGLNAMAARIAGWYATPGAR